MLHRMDMLTAEPVTLLVNGNSHYTTICGSVLTILMIIIFIVVAATTSPATIEGKIASVQLNQLLQKNYYGRDDEKQV